MLILEAEFGLGKAFRYPFSRRWVILSLILSVSSFVLAFLVLGFHVYFFLVLALPQVLLFTFVKNRLYRKIDATDLNPLLYFGGGGDGGIIYVVMLISLVFFGFALPFILLLFLEPVIWFVSILSFVFGINFPELILFTLMSKKGNSKL